MFFFGAVSVKTSTAMLRKSNLHNTLVSSRGYFRRPHVRHIFRPQPVREIFNHLWKIFMATIDTKFQMGKKWKICKTMALNRQSVCTPWCHIRPRTHKDCRKEYNYPEIIPQEVALRCHSNRTYAEEPHPFLLLHHLEYCVDR